MNTMQPLGRTAQMPPHFFWEVPPFALPIRAVGAVVMDANHQVVCQAPNASTADVIAYSINVANDVHPRGVMP